MMFSFRNKLVSFLLYSIFLSFLFSCGEKDEAEVQNEALTNGDKIKFSSYLWENKETKNIADSRYFCLTKKENVQVDESGNLVLKISKNNGLWSGGEITIDTTLGFGEYSFDVKVKTGHLDANATLAFTILNITDDFYEGMTQTGVRFSKYSESDAPNELEYFLYATDKKFAEVQIPENPFLLSELVSNHKVGIYPNYLYYSSKAAGGFYNEFKAMKVGSGISDITDALTFSEPTDHLKLIISLCLPEANEPSNGKEVEVILSNFKFSPYISGITKLK